MRARATRRITARLGLLVVAVTVAGAGWLLPAVAGAATGASVLELETLGGRADLVSGDDALIEVRVPDGWVADGLTATLGARDVSDAFAVRSDGRMLGLLTDLADGPNELTVTLASGHGASLTITNHDDTGPIFSGPHVEPWTCNQGDQADGCRRAPTYEFFYVSTDPSSSGFQPYDPESPPSDVAVTTTDEGREVPFIVRRETGTLLRDEYRIAVLYDPSQPWTPTEPQDGWNRKVVVYHGASCNVTFASGSAPEVMSETPLGRGFLTMSHALENSGHNCNVATQAESVIATKERVVDHYGGPIRYTIGSGCSGGALAQQHIANAYPGVYQGISPACSFTDSFTSSMQYQDYILTRRYFENPQLWGAGVVWAPNQIAIVNGHPNLTNPITFTEVIAKTRDPSRDCPGLDDELVYHHDSNPTGVRCSLNDYMVNVLGRRDASVWTDNEVLRGEGHANTPLDNIGVQYGLSGLLSGEILPHQFVDVNAKLGSRDIDYEQQQPRGAADPGAIRNAYRSGAANVGNNMDEVAIIDLRGPDPGAFHDVYRTYAMRERLIAHFGHADNQLLWRGSVALFGDATFEDDAILALDEWLAAVEADTRDVPLAQKLIEDRPEHITHRCTDGAGTDVPAAYCDAIVESYSTPRFEAGMPLRDDIMKCQLVPLEDFDYGSVTFTDAQWATLQEVFPTGVCDYGQVGVEYTMTVPWMTYAQVQGGAAMAPAPVSVPFAPAPAGGSSPLPATGGGAAGLSLAALLGTIGVVRWRRHR